MVDSQDTRHSSSHSSRLVVFLSLVRKCLSTIPPVVPILLLALALRVGYMPGFGHDDLFNSTRWTKTIQISGLLSFYAQRDPARLYPPLAMAVMAATAYLPWAMTPGQPAFLFLLKLFPVLCDLALIILCYFYLRNERTLRWLIPTLLAVFHGLTLVSAWWGQNDSQFTLFIVLTLIALNRDRPVSAWIFFGLGVLTKQQSLVLSPLILILTFRRYGLRVTVKGMAAASLAGVLILTPFAIGSGVQNVLKPYFGSPDAYPVATANALNFWYIATPHQKAALPWPKDIFRDNQSLFGPLSYKDAGLVLVGIYVALICVVMWRRSHERQEFIWAAALFYGVFMLPTQMHERYLFPAAVLVLIGVAQDRRLWPVALGTMFTFTYNIALIVPVRVRFLWPESIALHVALLNVALLIELTRISVFPPPSLVSRVSRFKYRLFAWEHRLLRSLLVASRIGAALIALSLVTTLVSGELADYPAAQWLAAHVADNARLAAERLEIVHLTDDWDNTATWNWRLSAKIDATPISEWNRLGVQYLLVDDRASAPGEVFSQRLEKLVDQGATIVYQSPNRAVLWTFRPQHFLNLTFAGCITLTGYDLVNVEPGKTSLHLYWYTRQPTPVVYSVFVHLIDPATHEMVGQADTGLGQNGRPTNTWQHGELFVDTVDLPGGVMQVMQNLSSPFHLLIGLYEPYAGNRASITSAENVPLGNQIELTIP